MNEYTAEYPQTKVEVGQITEADLKEAMLGTPGDPTYAQQFGMTSAPLGTTGYKPPTMAELELEADKALARAQAEAAAAQQANAQPDPFAAPMDEAAKWQKLYGDSENEKGALRKNQQELMEAFNGLMAQYEALQSNPNMGNPAATPQYGQAQAYVPTQDPFAGLGDDDVVQGKQIKDLLHREIGPALGAVLQQNQQAMARMAQLEGRIVKQTKEASGITPVDEFRLTARNPWVRDLSPAQRAQALSSLKQAELITQPPPVPQAPAQIPAPTAPQQRILNRMTYVEGSVPQVPDSSEAALEAAKARDYAKVMAAPPDTGERAKMFRAFAAKYGLALGQNPSDLAR